MRTAKVMLASVLVMSVGVVAGPAAGHGDPAALAGASCSQMVTNLQVEAAAVRDLVPARFTMSREIVGKAAVGYRVLWCPTMTLDGQERSDVVWSELGVRIMAPDARLPDHVDTHAVDGHDYYMLFFHTNDAALAEKLREAGLPAEHIPAMRYDLTIDMLNGSLLAGETVPDEGEYRVSLTSLTPDSPPNPDFVIRGWHLGALGLAVYAEQRTDVTARLSQLSLHADPGTLLARLLARTDVDTYDALVSFATSGSVELVEPA